MIPSRSKDYYNLKIIKIRQEELLLEQDKTTTNNVVSQKVFEKTVSKSNYK